MGILTLSQAVQHVDVKSPPLFPTIPEIPRSWISAGIAVCVAFGLRLFGCLLLEMSALQEAVILLFFVLVAGPLVLIARRTFVLKMFGHDLSDPPSLSTITLAAAFPACVNLAVTALVLVFEVVR